LRLAQTFLATLALILAAPLAADYFQDERVAPVLQVLAFSLLISGCENIGVVAFQKHMQFGAEFRFLFLRRIAGFVITISLALVLRSYWALVVGALGGRAVGVALSYLLHPMRPRLSLQKFHDIFSVSQWILVRSVGSYLHGNLHKILVGRWSTTPTMGAYSLADDISALPSGELLAPLNRVLFPAFSEAQHNLDKLKQLYLRTQGMQTLLAIPAAVGLALVADEAVRVLLGERWLEAVPFVQILALVSVAQALTTSGGYVLIVLGRIRNLVLLTWTQVLLFVACAFLLIPEQEALAIAWLRLLVAAAGTCVAFWLLLSAFPIVRGQEIFRTSIRPLAGAAAMAAALLLLPFPTDFPVSVSLALKIAIGALVYVCSVLGTWWLAGRPDGAESSLLRQARIALAARKA
jgi:O-antigen/teichoic acid export membrane protein